MRILRVTRAYPPVWDGAANHVVGLSTQQARAGHRVWVLQPHLPDSSDDPPLVTRLRVPLPTGFQRRIYASKTAITMFHVRAWRLERQICRGQRVDIIHVHGDALDGFLQARAAQNGMVPLVQTVHSGLSRRWLYRWTAPRLLQHVTRFIAVAETVAADLMALGILADRIAVISSGVDVTRFHDLPKVARRPHLVSIGRLEPVKGYPYLLEALRLLAGRGLRPPVTVVGEGRDRETLASLARDLPNVHFVGALPHSQIPDLLSRATLFVLPSVDVDGQREGTPTVLMEAMAAGLPIVTTDAAAAELIRHRINGLVAPQRSAMALATAIQEILQDPISQRRMAETNRAVAVEKDWSTIERQVARVYEAALRECARITSPRR